MDIKVSIRVQSFPEAYKEVGLHWPEQGVYQGLLVFSGLEVKDLEPPLYGSNTFRIILPDGRRQVVGGNYEGSKAYRNGTSFDLSIEPIGVTPDLKIMS